MLSSSINRELWRQQTRRQRTWHVIKIFLNVSLFGVAFVFLGAEVEKAFVLKAKDTKWAYNSDKVCGWLGGQTVGKFKINEALTTYDSYDEAQKDGATVAHCGECGWCSNAADVNIIDETRDTLTKTTTECAKLSIPFGRWAVERCMDEKVGFTKECRDCWVDNVMCTLVRCGFTCTKSVFLYKERNNVDGKKTLNPCLECDEKMCGPNFITCTGANRRRAGIISDIKRSGEEEVCGDVDKEWKDWLEVLRSIHEDHFAQYSRRLHPEAPIATEL